MWEEKTVEVTDENVKEVVQSYVADSWTIVYYFGWHIVDGLKHWEFREIQEGADPIAYIDILVMESFHIRSTTAKRRITIDGLN